MSSFVHQITQTHLPASTSITYSCVKEEKELSRPSELAETPVIKDLQEKNKKKFINRYTSWIHGSWEGKKESCSKVA